LDYLEKFKISHFPDTTFFVWNHHWLAVAAPASMSKPTQQRREKIDTGSPSEIDVK
jgi:hypothetical protein